MLSEHNNVKIFWGRSYMKNFKMMIFCGTLPLMDMKKINNPKDVKGKKSQF